MFLHFEALFAADKTSYHELQKILLNPRDLKTLTLDKELRDFLLPLAYNIELHKEICQVLLKYNHNFIRTTHSENIAFIQLVDVSKKLFPGIDSLLLATSLLSTFFVHSLNASIKTSTIEDDLVGKPRYEVIFYTKTLLKQFTLQLEITTGISIKLDNNTQTLVWVLLQTLINHGTLQSKTRHTAKDKTEVFVAANKVSQHFLSKTSLKLLTKPATTLYIRNTLYIQTQHYSSLQPVLRPNMASRKKPKLTNLTFFHSRINMRLYINGQLLSKILGLVETHFKVELNDTEKFCNLLKTLKVSWGNTKTQTRYNELYKLYYLYLLNQNHDAFSKGIYFCYYLDFRGRIYADSPISYTFNKTTRWLYNYGCYTTEELDIYKTQIPDLSKLVLEKILQNTNLQVSHPLIDYDDKVVKYYVFTVFFELGKTQKNKAINISNGKLNTEDIVGLGIAYYNEGYKAEAEFEDKVEYIALIDILDLLNEGIFLKLPIYKDATASALQLLLILLGPANEQILTEGNLKNTGYWYDTYYGIIERFFKTTQLDENLKIRYFTRAALKKTIMTHNYQATYLTCLNEFKAHNGLPGDNNKGINTTVIPVFRAFYRFLNTLFDSEEYFAISSGCIVDGFKKQGETTRQVHFTTLDDLFIPLEYTKLTKQRVERLILTKRETILGAQTTDEIDEAKMFRALRANIIHSFDGYLVRSVTIQLGYPIITIHDSFGIDILNVPKLIEITQKELNKLVTFKMFASEVDTRREFIIDSDFVLL